ncbi:MAG: cytochrome c oxidase subunit II [Acidimicrobiia bacterium]
MVRSPRRLRLLRVLAIAAGVGALLLLAGCAGDAPQDVLKPEGPIARTQDGLFKPIFYLAVVPVFVLVQGLVIATVIRHRHRPGRPDPVQVHGNTKLEIGWTAAPALILLFAAVPTINTIFDIAAEPANPLEIDVYGHMWWWEYIYPEQDGISQQFSTANEMHIPVDRPVRLSLHTVEPGLPAGPEGELAQGVIHSFWVPKLAGKQDVVPGRVNKLTIEADKPGQRYLGQCAEYCNLSHANMRLAVKTHTPGDFEDWVASQQRPVVQPASGEAADGYKIFTGKGGCLACHSVTGIEGAVSRVGPNLTHLKARDRFAGYVFDNNRENLRKWVDNPSAMKPMRPEKGTGMPDQGLSPEELDRIVAFLETLQ